MMASDNQLVVPEASRLSTRELPALAEPEETNSRKRRREGHLDGDEAGEDAPDAAADDSGEQAKMSKNQLKKLKRQQIWEDRKAYRKLLRKEKRVEKKDRKRLERDEQAARLTQESGITMDEAFKHVLAAEKRGPRHSKHQPVPVAFIIDCDYEQYMRESEIVSLGSQITRSYSMNKQGTYQAHLLISSWGGKLRERFETVLKNAHTNWTGVTFIKDDFLEAGKAAWDILNGPRGGHLCVSLGGTQDNGEQEMVGKLEQSDPTLPVQQTETASGFTPDSVVYLSADSLHVLDKLEPFTSYVIGGLVDRNREKLLCQRRAEDKGIKTAKLPIGKYMQMESRQVLTTNHVVEIMSKWLETGDWANAFSEVIPKRKGGRLRANNNQGDEDRFAPGEFDDDTHHYEETRKNATADDEV